MKAEYVDHMGSDLSVVNAARVSFSKASDWGHGPCDCDGPDEDGIHHALCSFYKNTLKDADARLIHYLARHNHWTPFAHTAITLRMAAPVPIRTQCFKHSVGFTENEESRRYIKSEPVVFMPKEWRKAPTGSAKQGSGASFEPWEQEVLNQEYQQLTGTAVRQYIHWVEDRGVCPEQARFLLPQGVEVNWMWTGNLASYARFFKQRTDPHAQQEIQDLARDVGEIIRPLFPVSWEALTNG